MFLVLQRCFLIFALLFASTSDQAFQASSADGPATFDQAPPGQVAIGHRAPDGHHLVEAIPHESRRPERLVPSAAAVAPTPSAPPRCVRPIVMRKLHMMRRRVPRMRDDGDDH